MYHICDAKNINEAHPILKTKRGNKNIEKHPLIQSWMSWTYVFRPESGRNQSPRALDTPLVLEIYIRPVEDLLGSKQIKTNYEIPIPSRGPMLGLSLL